MPSNQIGSAAAIAARSCGDQISRRHTGQEGLTPPSRTAAQLRLSVHCARQWEFPFRHWLLDKPLTMRNLAAIVDLPFAPTLIGDTLGKRETHNSSRLFFAADEQARFPVCRDVADAFQNQGNVAYLEALCGIDLAGSYLRIEYCRDTDGFWLAPHTDIGTKLLTILIYVSNEPGCMAWGTDLLTPDGKTALTVPYVPNTGLMFVPGRDSWHGFHKRPINGVRRTLIVNYVRVEWRARRELAFPDNAIGRPLSSASLTAFV